MPIVLFAVIVVVVVSFLENSVEYKTSSTLRCEDKEISIFMNGREDLLFSVDNLVQATNNFDRENIIGRGGHGLVFKGELKDKNQLVAIKKMNRVSSNTKPHGSLFEREIEILSLLNHKNIVKLLGYCSFESEHYLIYEYIPRGPLSNYLFAPEMRGLKPLDWRQRLSIALDISSGLEYLHNGTHFKIIHRDIKPSNILLGENMEAKIADFGLGCILPGNDDSSIHLEPAGTEGHIAPESFGTVVSTLADIFSFGVTIMELISGQQATEEVEGDRLLFRFRKALWTSNQSIETIIDPSISCGDEIIPHIVKLANLAIQCTLEEPEKRIKVECITRFLSDIIYPLQIEFAPPREEDEDVYGISRGEDMMSILHNMEIENLY